VVQLARVRIRRAARVARNFVGAQLAGVPAPRQSQLPRAAVRAEQRAERAELKPPHVELAGELLRRHEAADVGSPEWNAAQAGVHGNGDMRLQCFPRRVDIARPEKGGVALHAGITVAMERERAFVRTLLA